MSKQLKNPAWDVYSTNLREYIKEQMHNIETADDYRTVSFAYQRILEALHDACDHVVDGVPSFTDEKGGI